MIKCPLLHNDYRAHINLMSPEAHTMKSCLIDGGYCKFPPYLNSIQKIIHPRN